ncbi:MAG: MBL fold metallo-hydrolase [Amphiplicatus sp.]
MSGQMKEGAFRVVILGSGSSGGVPRLGGADGAGDWGACDPNEPRNRRRRCSALVQRSADSGWKTDVTTSVLIDTAPDLREQLLDARCGRLDAVLFTHDHADQCHGIDDVRAFALTQRARVPVYIDDATSGNIPARFAYCFQQEAESLYVPILEQRAMPACGECFLIDGPGGAIPVTAFLQFHGAVNSLGFRCGDIAYSSDVVRLPEQSFELLRGTKTWIVDALQYKPHKTHSHLAQTLEWIERVKPERAIVTNLHNHMDYQTLRRELPQGVEPAYDGMIVEGSLA